MSFFRGRKESFKQVPTKTGQQQDFLSNLLSGLGQGGLGGQGYQAAIQNLLGILQGSPESYQAMEAPSRTAFAQQTIPSILERFSGAGARSSSGLQQTLGQAGSQLEQGLAAQRAGMQQNAVSQLLSNFMNQSGLGLGTNTFENVYRPGQQGIFGQLAGAFSPALGQFAQGYGQSLGYGQSPGINNVLQLLAQLGGV
jgi:hypothetical protein